MSYNGRLCFACPWRRIRSFLGGLPILRDILYLILSQCNGLYLSDMPVATGHGWAMVPFGEWHSNTLLLCDVLSSPQDFKTAITQQKEGIVKVRRDTVSLLLRPPLQEI